MNNVSLIGRLTADPEMHTYERDGEQRSLAQFRLAIDNPGQDTTYVNVVAFGKTAEAMAEHVGKGRKVAVEGRITTSEWQADNGERRFGAPEIAARRVDFLERVKDAQATLDRIATGNDAPTAELAQEPL